MDKVNFRGHYGNDIFCWTQAKEKKKNNKQVKIQRMVNILLFSSYWKPNHQIPVVGFPFLLFKSPFPFLDL